MTSVVTFSQFAAGMARAVTDTIRSVSRSVESDLEEAFETAEDGQTAHRVQTIPIADGHQVPIPMLTVAPLRERRIREATMKFSAVVAPDDSPEVADRYGGVKVEVAMTFETGEPIEAIELVKERLHRDTFHATQHHHQKQGVGNGSS